MTGIRYVIQTFGTPPLYAGSDNHWKADINYAARFSTEAAAQAVADCLKVPTIVVEHMWLRGLTVLY